MRGDYLEGRQQKGREEEAMMWIWLAVWFVVATVLTVIGTSRSKDTDEVKGVVFIAMTWPAWLAIAILFSPAILGIGVVALWRKK
jgi:hypothetical protein